MKWFEGSVADAVSASKNTSSVFVVYIEGQDDMSKNMSSALDKGSISAELSSSRFVCIKLSKDSESHRQFTEIYKIVPVPSLFFIGENGVPLEIIASDHVIDNVTKKINAAISKIKGVPLPVDSSTGPTDKTSENSPSVSGSSDMPSESSLPSVSQKPNSETLPPPSEETNVVNLAEMERVEELIKKKREENSKLEEEKEKEKELARRKMGKEISVAKKSQQERELDEMRKEREKDKKLEAEARQRVLRQIEEDKANRAARVTASLGQAPAKPSSTTQNEMKPTQPINQASEGRIQFKLPNGQTRTQTFPNNTTIRDLRIFIDSNITIPFKEYLLATTFPRREFTNRDLDRDLGDLGLLPSSVILILPVQGNMTISRGPRWTATVYALFWGMVQPLLDFGSYLGSFFSGRRSENTPEDSGGPSRPSSADEESTQSDQQQRPPYYGSLGQRKSVRRRGNVHTLSDGNDSNDENNTWNGNSTQLM